jgi:hypothetical protein
MYDIYLIIVLNFTPIPPTPQQIEVLEFVIDTEEHCLEFAAHINATELESYKKQAYCATVQKER